jgi:hypothetical protein
MLIILNEKRALKNTFLKSSDEENIEAILPHKFLHLPRLFSMNKKLMEALFSW